MSDRGHDQADGLRRLFQRPDPPVIAFVGGQAGCGVTHIACALAQRLAERGMTVTLVDEHRGQRSATRILGARVRYDLLQSVSGDVLLTQAVVMAGEGMQLVPAARLAQRTGGREPQHQARLAQCWRSLCAASDVILIDAYVGAGGKLSPLAAKAGNLVLVSGIGSAAVMGAYLTLKQVTQARSAARIGLLVNRAMDALQAGSIFNNMRGLVRAQLGRELESYDWLPPIAAWRTKESELSAAGAARLAAVLDAILPPELRHDRCSDNDERNQSVPSVGGRPGPPALAAQGAAGNTTCE